MGVLLPHADTGSGGGTLDLLTSSGNGAGYDTDALAERLEDGYAILGPGEFEIDGSVITEDEHPHIFGLGAGITSLKLADGADTDLFVTEGFDDLTGGTTRGGPEKFGFHNLTLDGNKAGNASGRPLRVFGACYVMDHVEIKGGASGGWWSEWGTGGTDMRAHTSDVTIHDCDGWGLEWGGPHDSVFAGCEIFKNENHVRTFGNATTEKFSLCHTWGTEAAIGWWFKAEAHCMGCTAEGSTDANVILDCNNGQWIGGQVHGSDNGAEVGFEFGRDSVARYWDIRTRMHKFAATGIPLNYVASAGNQVDILYDPFPSTPTVLRSGTLATYDDLLVRCPTNPTLGATWTRRVSTGGEFQTYSESGTRATTLKAVGTEIYFQMHEAATINPATADSVRLAGRDNGSGKSQLVVRFPSGSPVAVETEP